MDITIHPSATETSSGNTASFGTGNMALCGMFVNVTAANGVLPSMIVTLQHSPDGQIWYSAGNINVTVTNIISIASTPPALLLLADYSRCSWTITGTSPSFTFSVDLVTHPA